MTNGELWELLLHTKHPDNFCAGDRSYCDKYYREDLRITEVHEGCVECPCANWWDKEAKLEDWCDNDCEWCKREMRWGKCIKDILQ